MLDRGPGVRGRAVPSALEHVLARGHRGIVLDFGGAFAKDSYVEQLITRMTDHLRGEGLWTGWCSRRPAVLATPRWPWAVDLAVLDLREPGGGSAWAERAERALAATAQDVLARGVLLCETGTGEAADDLMLGSSLVRDFGLRGLAVPAASMPSAADLIGHRFQIRRRAWPTMEPQHRPRRPRRRPQA
jgi:hypothetical protein